MSPTVNQTVPPGWYPDPGGSRSWRVWNGHEWTGVTRPFGEATSTIDVVGGGVALRRVTRVGVRPRALHRGDRRGLDGAGR